jgi:hypothetical protein
MIERVMRNPEQRDAVRPARVLLRSRVEIQGRIHLVRVFADTDREPAEAVTAYRTSKVNTYWRPEQ